MSDFDLRKHFKKQYLNEREEEYNKYDVLNDILDVLQKYPKNYEDPFYLEIRDVVKKFTSMKEGKFFDGDREFDEDSEFETDYAKRRKEEDDYYQDQDSLKEVNDLMEKIGFSGPDYNDELSITLKAINDNIHSKALSPSEPIVQQIGNQLGDILDLVNSLPEKGQMGKIGFRR